MRVAIPTENGQICLLYEQAKEFTIYDVEIELVRAKETVALRGRMADFLTKQEINAVICAAIRSETKTLLRTKRIELTYGVTGDADAIIIRYLSGERLGTIEENALLRLEADEELEEFSGCQKS